MTTFLQRDSTPGDTMLGSLDVVDITPPRWGAEDEISANQAVPSRRGRRLWGRVGEPLLLLAAVATVFAVTKLADDRDPSAPADTPAAAASRAPTSSRPATVPPATPVNSGRPRAASPRFVVPVTAHPGEQITIVGYRDDRFCGPTVLLFDGTPIPHQVRGTATPAAGGWVELYLTVQMPSSASLGAHRLDLLGPVAAGPGGVLCGDVPEHEERLADAEIIIIP